MVPARPLLYGRTAPENPNYNNLGTVSNYVNVEVCPEPLRAARLQRAALGEAAGV